MATLEAEARTAVARPGGKVPSKIGHACSINNTAQRCTRNACIWTGIETTAQHPGRLRSCRCPSFPPSRYAFICILSLPTRAASVNDAVQRSSSLVLHETSSRRPARPRTTPGRGENKRKFLFLSSYRSASRVYRSTTTSETVLLSRLVLTT